MVSGEIQRLKFTSVFNKSMSDKLKIKEEEIKRSKSGDIVVTDDYFSLILALQDLKEAIIKLTAKLR